MFVLTSPRKNFVHVMIGGMLIGLQPLKSQNSIEKIQLRITVATFNGNLSTIIISCYSSTNVRDETDLDACYNKQSFLVYCILKQNVHIIGGDMNAQIGKNVNNKFSLHNSMDFTQENELICLNTKFQKRKGKL